MQPNPYGKKSRIQFRSAVKWILIVYFLRLADVQIHIECNCCLCLRLYVVVLIPYIHPDKIVR